MATVSGDDKRVQSCVGASPADGLPANALAVAERSVRDVPQSPRSWHQLALALVAAGRYAEAEAAVRSGLTYDTRHAQLWLTFGDLARHDRRLDLARYCYRRAGALDPSAPLPWAGTALVLHDLGRGSHALRACRKARDLGHRDPVELHELERRITASLPGPRPRSRPQPRPQPRPLAKLRLQLPAAFVVAGALAGAALANLAPHDPTSKPASATGRTVPGDAPMAVEVPGEAGEPGPSTGDDGAPAPVRRAAWASADVLRIASARPPARTTGGGRGSSAASPSSIADLFTEPSSTPSGPHPDLAPAVLVALHR